MRAALAIIGSVVLALGIFILPGAYGADSKARDERVYPVIYNVSDLAVWQVDPTTDEPTRFNPQILIAHIRTYVGSDHWNDGTIRPFLKNASIVVFQTQDGHARVAKLLAALRDESEDERNY
jgi:hypothetical protein